MVNSGICEVGVITKYNYQSLIDHLGPGREWDLSRKVGGLHILPPFGNANYGLYRGKMDALSGALGYLTHSNAKHVVMSDCNIVANIDLRPMVEPVSYTHLRYKWKYPGRICCFVEEPHSGQTL